MLPRFVDRFEELYTLCAKSDRQPFLDLLLHAVKSAPAFTLIAIVRADFWNQTLTHGAFSDALAGANQVVEAMNADELQTAIARASLRSNGRGSQA